MPETPVDVWSEVRRLRCDVADRIEALSPEQWEAQSWCAGWRVRDVLGHLVHLAEASQLSMVRAVLRAGARPDRALDRAARRVGAEPVLELAQRLRDAADGRYHVLGTPPAVALGEVLVHSGDALRPLGLTTDAPPADVALVLDFYVRFGRLAFHTPQPRSTCLVAIDVNWRRGEGPEVRGKAIDLLLLQANRRRVIPSLEGPGVVRLTGQIRPVGAT